MIEPLPEPKPAEGNLDDVFNDIASLSDRRAKEIR